MTGVYEHALGPSADDLHPKVRERYSVGPDDTVVCVGSGEMDVDGAGALLPVFYAMTVEDLLFPESGSDVPFTVTTVGYRTDSGHEALTTRRAFDFEGRTRRFDSVTVWDDDSERLFDFLGRRGLLVSELRPRVEDGALVVEGGRQWLRAGDRYVPLPGPTAAAVEVRDRYDDGEERYHVTGTVDNSLVGEVFSYRGTFTQEFRERTSIPADLRSDRIPARLPPR